MSKNFSISDTWNIDYDNYATTPIASNDFWSTLLQIWGKQDNDLIVQPARILANIRNSDYVDTQIILNSLFKKGVNIPNIMGNIAQFVLMNKNISTFYLTRGTSPSFVNFLSFMAGVELNYAPLYIAKSLVSASDTINYYSVEEGNTAGENTITVFDAVTLTDGIIYSITGPGIPTDTTIASAVVSGNNTTFTLSNPLSANISSPTFITITNTDSSGSVVSTTTTNIQTEVDTGTSEIVIYGNFTLTSGNTYLVTGTGIQEGTDISSVSYDATSNMTTLTLSKVTSAQLSGTTTVDVSQLKYVPDINTLVDIIGEDDLYTNGGNYYPSPYYEVTYAANSNIDYSLYVSLLEQIQPIYLVCYSFAGQTKCPITEYTVSALALSEVNQVFATGVYVPDDEITPTEYMSNLFTFCENWTNSNSYWQT